MISVHITRAILRWGIVLWLGGFLLVVGVWQVSQLWQAHQQVLTFLGWDGQTYALYEVNVPDGEPYIMRGYTRAWLPPVWSPDGRRLAIDTNTDIRLGYPLTSTHTTLSDLPSDRTQPRWSPDGQWLAFNTLVGDERDIMLWRAGSDDPPFHIAVTAQRESAVCWASDSRRFAYAVADGWRYSTIEMITLPQGDAPYTPEILAEVQGAVTDMVWSPVSGADTLAIASNAGNITLLDAKSGTQEIIVRHGYIADLEWSPDGRYLLFIDTSYIASTMMSDVYAVEIATQEVRNLSDYPGLDMSAVWSPDGQWIAWVSNRGENAVERNVVLMHAATGTIRELTSDFVATGGLAWWP